MLGKCEVKIFFFVSGIQKWRKNCGKNTECVCNILYRHKSAIKYRKNFKQGSNNQGTKTQDTSTQSICGYAKLTRQTLVVVDKKIENMDAPLDAWQLPLCPKKKVGEDTWTAFYRTWVTEIGEIDTAGISVR